jgi:hypothetical protein
MSDTAAPTYFLRKSSVVVGTAAGDGVDLSSLHHRFITSIRTTDSPNTLKLRIWNLAQNTINTLTQQNSGTYEFSRVVLKAGYQQGPYGTIFDGEVMYMRKGRENGTDTFLDIDVGEGNKGYNFGVVNTTIAPGTSLSDAAKQVNNALAPHGVTAGQLPAALGMLVLPRGYAMFGMARDYANRIASNAGMTWSINQSESAYLAQANALPQVVELNAGTGMIGVPEQTIYGVNVRSLINPNFKPGITLHLNNADIKLAEQNLSFSGSAQNAFIDPDLLNKQGLYKILAMTFEGDSRGGPWYCNITCNDINQPVSYGAVQSKWVP